MKTLAEWLACSSVTDGSLVDIEWALAEEDVAWEGRAQDLAQALIGAGWTRKIRKKGRKWYAPGVEVPNVRNIKSLVMRALREHMRAVGTCTDREARIAINKATGCRDEGIMGTAILRLDTRGELVRGPVPKGADGAANRAERVMTWCGKLSTKEPI